MKKKPAAGSKMKAPQKTKEKETFKRKSVKIKTATDASEGKRKSKNRNVKKVKIPIKEHLDLLLADESESEEFYGSEADARGMTSKQIKSEQSLDVDDYEEFDEEIGDNDKVNDTEPASNFDLVESIKQISATRRRPIKRKEAAQNVEEFVVVKRRVNVGDGGVNKFLESVKEAGETKAVDKVTRIVSATEKGKGSKQKSIKTLEAPAERIVAEKTKRTVLYENAKEEVSKWNSAVYHNRTAEQLVFPLSQDKKAFKKPAKGKEKSEFMPVTPLEEEIAKVLYGEDYVERKKAEMAEDSKKTDMESYLLSVEEAMATHSEMAKFRALQSYAMAKAKRQNKIKSKKYHRLLRKSKIKQQLKEFEELQKKDPEGAMLKLEELNNARITERMNLKHRNTSKWAKMQAARAKYDKDSRMALSEQLKISRDLTQKIQESSDEDEADMELPVLVRSSVENPWMLKPSLKDNEKLQMYYTGYKKFWDEYNKQQQKEKLEEDSDEEDDKASVDQSHFKNGNKKSRQTSRSKDGDADEVRDIVVNEEDENQEYSGEPIDEESGNISNLPLRGKGRNSNANDMSNEIVKTTLEVNPDNFLKIKKSGSSIAHEFSAENSQVVDLLEDDESSNDETDQRNLIAEAFEDDFVVSEFQKQKKDIVDESQPQDIDNYLPGWGSWTGEGVSENPRKHKRFTKKAKKRPPRKDANISHVILNEDVDAKVRSHQVKNIPFPFTRVKDFEKTIRAPIGRTWMPEQAVKSLTAPKVITRLGGTIKPISDDVLVKPKKQKFNVPNTIMRLAKVTSKK